MGFVTCFGFGQPADDVICVVGVQSGLLKVLLKPVNRTESRVRSSDMYNVALPHLIVLRLGYGDLQVSVVKPQVSYLYLCQLTDT